LQSFGEAKGVRFGDAEAHGFSLAVARELTDALRVVDYINAPT